MSPRPAVSVVVVAYDMARELPRTLRSLAPSHQRGVDGIDYEIIVVDNGSPEPVGDRLVSEAAPNARVVRLDPAPPSPVKAANLGLSLARGELVGLLVDGARLASPGLVAGARRAATLAERPVVTAPAFHLGSVPHMRAPEAGYDQSVEDELLAGCGWEQDGYALFGVSTPAASSARGLFGPMGESNSLFMPRPLWDELGGMDERFVLPGGGLANHDLYRRACELDGTEVVVMLGEGTFHQFHGGAATSRRLTWEDMHAEYVAIRGRPHAPPERRPTYVGHLPPAALWFVEHSVRWAARREAAAGGGVGAGSAPEAPAGR